ncbi:EF-P lysine aminoacylase EpmA [Salinarimonas chemoclinalis]|uniref:EF-P lysine aminoacylase EpmA n=1 Tax=Salinarimonas chemoclinalis TaxID=3241599 RepID=UPI003556D8F0
MQAPSPFWDARRHADRRPFLVGRGAVTDAVRAHFRTEGFLEVETACLQISPGNEAHLHAFRTPLSAADGRAREMYLHTSPEFACKKLLAAGETRIFTLARVFRNRERSPLHHPEFTMLEWYRVGAPWETLWADCAALLSAAADATGARAFSWRGATCDPRAEPEILTLAEAFDRHAGIDLLASLDARGAGDRETLAAGAREAGIRVADDDGWSDVFSKVLVARIEPHLGIGRPTILCAYPACEAALARASARDPRVAERFELYACGVELANGFGELTDPTEQRRRFTLEMDEKQRVWGERYPLDEDFLAALAAMPEAAGCALGFDRLSMLATGARHVEDVLWAPVADPFDDDREAP